MNKTIVNFALATALTVTMAASALAQTAADALQVVKDSTTVLLADLKANKTNYKANPTALNQLIDSKMVPYFDAEAMARLVLAQNWNQATPQQQQDFLNEFKQLLMRTYSSNLLDYAEATLQYGSPEAVNRNRTKIDVTVRNADGTVYPLTLSMAYRQGVWRIYNVNMDGFDAIASYRSSLGQEVEQKGLQTVIDEIKAKNKKGDLIK